MEQRKRVDLNLLTVFEAVWRERNVARAADRLAMSQPAVSHALARLRGQVADPLFVRAPGGVRPTPRAETLWPSVERALASARAAFGEPLDPLRLGRPLRLGMTRNVALSLTAILAERARSRAPTLDLILRAVDRRAAPELLSRGVIDAMVGSWPGAPPAGGIRRRLYAEDLVLIAQRGHPILSGPLDPRRVAAEAHVLVSPSGDEVGALDAALADLGLSRRIALVVPDYALAAEAVAASDLVGAIGAGPAARTAARLPIASRALPFQAPTVAIDLILPASAAPLADWMAALLSPPAPSP